MAGLQATVKHTARQRKCKHELQVGILNVSTSTNTMLAASTPPDGTNDLIVLSKTNDIKMNANKVHTCNKHAFIP